MKVQGAIHESERFKESLPVWPMQHARFVGLLTEHGMAQSSGGPSSGLKTRLRFCDHSPPWFLARVISCCVRVLPPVIDCAGPGLRFHWGWFAGGFLAAGVPLFGRLAGCQHCAAVADRCFGAVGKPACISH